MNDCLVHLEALPGVACVAVGVLANPWFLALVVAGGIMWAVATGLHIWFMLTRIGEVPSPPNWDIHK